VFNTTGSLNTGIGANALYNHTTGTLNVALGWAAGDRTTGDNNIEIGNIGAVADTNAIRIGTQTAVVDEFGVTHPAHSATFIAGISGVPISHGMAVGVNPNGQLGVRPSSARYKEAIQPMDKSSEAILALKPVTFRYQKQLDPEGAPQFGLVAEEVAKVNPDLVVADDQGKPFTVRYEEVNAMLLNEFLKEHRKVEELEKQVAALAAGFQRVSAQLELSKSAPQTVLNNR
jgi:hypothetical protein